MGSGPQWVCDTCYNDVLETNALKVVAYTVFFSRLYKLLRAIYFAMH